MSARIWLVLAALSLASAPARSADRPAPAPACTGDAAATAPVGSASESGTTPFARQDVKAVAERITCYCGCPHLQVSKCFCGTAEEIRSGIAAGLDRGMSPDDVVAAYVADHGTWSLAVPPRHGFNWIIWLAPVALVVGGTVVLLLAGQRWSHAAAAPAVVPDPVPAADRERYRAFIEKSLR